MKNGSSPGLDGLPIEVYKVLWNDIKPFLINCFHDCFKKGMLTPSQSQALLCLLHKGGDNPREAISSWRPISLLNSDYKLIAKLFSRRLCNVTEKLVHENQFAFIKGRNIATMLRELYDIIENEKHANSNTILLSIDYSKAFDTLSTKAIIDALELYGFGAYFLKWINILLTNRTCCVRNGGYISQEFNMERGVRQGCPISPILFILTSELFAASVRADANIKGLRLLNSQRFVKILQYADDITLLIKDLIDFREVLSRIKLFSEFSGLKLNIKKTYAMKLGGESWEGRFEEGIQFVQTIKILGIFFSSTMDARLIPENTEGKIKSLERICALWSRRPLTIIGKILILKVFGLSLFINVIQSIGLSIDDINRINKIFYTFIWKRKNDGNKVIERVKRSVLCNAKVNGGLAMIDLKKFQESFLLRWAGRLIDASDEDWKYILSIKSLLKVGGKSAFMSSLSGKKFKGLIFIYNSFWRDVLQVWLDNRHQHDDDNAVVMESPICNNTNITYKNSVLFFPQLLKQNIIYIKDVTFGNKMIDLEHFQRLYRLPDSVLIYNCIYNALFPHFNSLFNERNSCPDNNITNLTKFCDIDSGTIGRKGFYSLLSHPVTPNSELYWARKIGNDFPKEVWLIPFNCTIESRLHVLQWKILVNIFPTAIILSKMKIKPSENCESCDARETIDHFFFFCSKRKKIWNLVESNILYLLSKRLKLTWQDAILGVLPSDRYSKQELKTINIIILLAKLSISKSEYGSKQDPCIILENELSVRGIM